MIAINKQYIQVQCDNYGCLHWTDPCCRVCTEVVYVKEPRSVDLFFVGMGAGKDEDININPNNTNRQPFFGRAGKYLRKIIMHLWSTDLKFNIALSNNVRCHPKNPNGKDREPTAEELKMCINHLINDIEFINPKVVVTLGRNASLSLLPISSDLSMGKIRALKSVQRHFGEKLITVIPTYHPSYLCRNYGGFNPNNNNNFDLKVISDIKRALELRKNALL